MMKIYCARPITGLGYKEIELYYNNITNKLITLGYNVLHPMIGKSYLSSETQFKSDGYQNPLSTDHAIVRRDNWMVKQCDILLLNLLESKKVSIGCMMELAWGYDYNKHIITLMEDNNIHKHSFVIESSSVIFSTEQEGFDYLYKLNNVII
jgi:hypothetical protein